MNDEYHSVAGHVRFGAEWFTVRSTARTKGMNSQACEVTTSLRPWSLLALVGWFFSGSRIMIPKTKLLGRHSPFLGR